LAAGWLYYEVSTDDILLLKFNLSHIYNTYFVNIHDIYRIFTKKNLIFYHSTRRSAHYLAFSLCQTATQIFAVSSLLIFTGPILPRNRVLLSNSVPQNMQATMQSATAALDSLATFLSPLFYLIYSYTVKQSGGAVIVYYVFTGLCFVSFILCVLIYINPEVYNNLPDVLADHDDSKPIVSYDAITAEDENKEHEES
jgi:hypothetical protein